MNSSSPFWEEKSTFFNNLKIQKSTEVKAVKSLVNRYGTIRALFFLISIIALVYFINERNGAVAWTLGILSPLIFGWLINKHNQYKRLLKLASNELNILDNELSRLKLDFSGIDGGEEFINHQHAYTTDMDVFGKHSLFALINRSLLTFGRTTLASWFRKHADINTIHDRQEATEELKHDFDWQLKWWAENRIHQHDKEVPHELVFDWFEDDTRQPNKWLRPIAVLGLIQFWTLTVLAIGGIVPAYVASISFFINLLLIGPVQNEIIQTQKLTEQLSIILNQHKGLFNLLLKKKFKSNHLQELKSTLEVPNAADKIAQLQRTLGWMHSRNGLMYWIIDPFVLTDYWVLSSSQNWKASYGKFVRNWFTTIGEMEALLSLSGYAFVHETYSIPDFSNDALHLKGTDIGHPLIKHEERICNDFEMQGKGSLTLITGANMSGKSTFERSLGINILLAQMGAVCCAKEFSLCSIRLFTSMRTQDDLSENTSSFYAELKRLKQLVDLTKEASSLPIFYLLDEILKGTNSEDRNKGAESLIKQLIKTNSMGLISTHDLSLASLDKEIEQFENYSFNSEVIDDKILFDYKLHQGACHTFNAVPLMKKMGIEIV